MHAPVLIKPIPAQVINEGAAYGPFDLKSFIQVPEGGEAARFQAEVSDGRALPKGMICTTDGILTGIPAKDSQGNYEVMVTAENAVGSIQSKFILTIKPSLITTGGDYFDKLKSQIWEALEQNLPIPDLGELYERPITALDIYYLLERWGTLTIWNAFDLNPPSDKKLLTLEGASKHYNVYDRGSSIVMCPKDLYSHERTIEDGLQTARAVAREIYNRGWTVEMAGFDKLTRAAWVEIQHLADKYGKPLEVINFNPSQHDLKLYSFEAENLRMKGLE